MKPRILIVSLMSLAVLSAIAAKVQDEHLIRYKLVPKQVDSYRLELKSDMKMSGPADQDIGVKGTMDYAMQVGEVGADGKADVEMKTTNIKIEANGAGEGMMQGQEMPKEITVKGKLDDRYRITDTKTAGLDANAQMMLGMSGAGSMTMVFELPEKAVKVGDTWQVKLPKSPMMGDKEYPLTAKLVGIKDYQGTPAYDVSVEGKVDLDLNMGEIFKKMSEASGGADGMLGMMAGLDISMKGSIGVTGTALLDRQSGRLLISETQLDTNQTMTVNSVGMTVQIAGKTSIKMDLKK